MVHPSSIPGFPSFAKRRFEALLQEPMGSFESVKEACSAHVHAFKREALSNEFVSVAEAERLAALCLRLIDGLAETAPEAERRLVWATARYFVERDDADHDFSIAGLEDDIAVANAVACYLGHADWCISL